MFRQCKDRVVAACWVFVALVGIVTAIALALESERMAPVRRGSVDAFWQIAAGVNLAAPDSNDLQGGGRAYIVDDRWAGYEVRGYHSSMLFYLPRQEAVEPFELVLQTLGRQEESGLQSYGVRGYVNWRNQEARPKEVESLLRSIDHTRHKSLASEDLDLLTYTLVQEDQFRERWHRAKWYWANFVFEWTLLTGLALFAVWPGIRQRGRIAWALHTGLLPIFFLLPTYLGYATWSFTSVGPSGGVVYPHLLLFTRTGSECNSFDQWLLAHLPQVLEPLSTPTGPWIAVSGGGMPGPTTAVIAGIILAAVVWTTASLVAWFRFRPHSVQSEGDQP